MTTLFEESDFSLFAQYQNKTQNEAPEGQVKLRKIYNKLGEVLDVLKKKGYHTQINRNPLTQGGQGIMKYCSYHWAKIYPQDESLFRECEGKVFVVIDTTQEGINIHIDSNSRNDYNSEKNDVTKSIKNNTWYQIEPSEAASYSKEELAQKVDSFFHENWEEFNRFAKEFGIQKSIEILKKMEIFKIKELLTANHNLILTGAPGTGKTYLAKQIAKQIIIKEIKEEMEPDEEKQFNEQCGFVQFHPSYDYTDFVEGLRPVRDDNGQIGFERKDGEFKDFCKKALKYSTNKKGTYIIEERFEKSWQKLLDFVRENIAKGVLTKIGIWEYGLSSSNSLKYSSLDTPSKYTFTINKKNVYDAYRGLQARPSGHFQKYIEDVVKFLIEKFDLQPYEKSEDFIKGQDNLPFVFIIDEINRGEISKIFGELFFSIDPEYRGKERGKVKTQYQNLIEEDDEFYDGFYVPENVYIIGTMNDIDRSVESMDFAFRRRFAFKEIKASDRVEMLYDHKVGLGSDAQKAEEKMKALNAAIEKIEGLSSAYHIGPAYFLKLKNYNGDFDQLWENHLKGLLREYLRGMQDVDNLIEKLRTAYNNESAPNN